MIVCDYCGKDCCSDHSEYKIEEYRWNYNGYRPTRNILHLHQWCRDEIITSIQKHRFEMQGKK